LGITPDEYIRSEKLRNFYNILALTIDKKGKPIVAAIEAKNYPFYSVMFHPERPIYDWNKNFDNPKMYEARALSRYYQIFFNLETRKSFSEYDSEEELKENLIYNYDIEPLEGIFDQIYKFPVDNSHLD
jgi:gamma-glutamyl hydrolase